MLLRLLAFLLAGTVVVLTLAENTREGVATPSSGFFTLTGSAARAYAPPADMRFARSVRIGDRTIERYQQFSGSAAVLGAQVTIVREVDGEPSAVIGSQFPGITPAHAARIDESAAVAVAARMVGAAHQRRVDLLLDPATRALFYRVESRKFDARWFHWIDAGNGRVIRAYNAVDSATGIGVKGDSKDLTGLTTFHAVPGHGAAGAHYDLQSSDGRQVTYDAQNRQALLYFVTDSDDTWNLVTSDRQSPGQPALIDAQYYANVADQFYLSAMGFDWLACTGLTAMQSVAHHKRDYDNAFWNGSYLVYGDGDGVETKEYSGALDVVVHESAHAVTDCTSALIYTGESGALNESFSDIMGSAGEFYAEAAGLDNSVSPDWYIAEDIMLVSDAAPGFRNMADPEEDSDPDHYSERFLGSEDNGGVHTNSGIPNHAFFLLVNGGQNASCPADPHCTGDGALAVDGIGLAAARTIFFTAFASLPENATMCQARAATIAVAGANEQSVADAWSAVGLTDALCLGTPSTPTATTTSTHSPTPTSTLTPSATATHTSTPTMTATPTATATPTPLPVDTDGDGCTDAQELGDDEAFGGDRDPNDYWDFFDVTEDRAIDLEDTLLILGHFGHGHNDDAVDPFLDRSAPFASQPWRTSQPLPGTEGVDLGDALISLQSFGHSCSATTP